MKTSVARKRLEEMRDGLDRTVTVLQGEHPLVRGAAAEAGDAGANLTEADRNEAAVQFAHHRSEIFDDLLPTVCVTDGVLRVDNSVCGYRNRKQPLESQAPNTKHGNDLMTPRAHIQL